MATWFTEADLMQVPPPAQRLFADICRLLDQLNPSKLAVDQQTAVDEDGEVVVRLVHISDRAADLDIEIGNRTTHVYGLYGHDEDYALPDDPEEAWRTASIDTIAGLLRGRYEVERSSWYGRPYRTRITDVIGDARIVTKLDSFVGLVPMPQSALTVATHEIDFGCSGNLPVSGPPR